MMKFERISSNTNKDALDSELPQKSWVFDPMIISKLGRVID